MTSVLTRPESRVPSAADFGCVAVLMGGTSSEREVSLDSGANVLDALRGCGVDAEAVDGIPALVRGLAEGRFARVFNILHGQRGGGEDGVVQGLLESYGIPCTGSGVLGTALAMDKVRSKQVWQALGLPTPEFRSVVHAGDLHAAVAALGLPVVVKPALEGSSVGISRVFADAELDAAQQLAARYPGPCLVERLVEGEEFTVAILGRRVLPSIKILPRGAYYDYNAKYIAEDTQYICPGLDGEAEAELGDLSLRAFDALGCAGWGRVDLMREQSGNWQLLEVNTAPGMTSHSLVPKAAAAAGIDYPQLCLAILATSRTQEDGA